MRQMDRYRLFEVGGVFAFLLAVAGLLIFNPSPGIGVTTNPLENTSIEADALAMPNQGWAPLRVYFSPFGSASQVGEIIHYEWDLDANGRYDTDATPSGGYVSYTYNQPGTYNVTLRVTDDHGNYATDNVQILVRHPASSSVDYWTIFDDSQVRKIEISLTRSNWDYMWSDPEAKLQVPSSAQVFGEPLEEVGFRMRGQFSLRESGDKKPWKIDTDAYVENQEYHNLRQLMLLNNIGDPSMLQEKLAYDMMHFAGVPASFACFAEVWIDFSDDGQPPVFWGIYSLVERVDKKFLANRFGLDFASGNLYKANHALRGPMDLIYYGPDIQDYPAQNGLYAYGKATNEAQADYHDIIALIYVIDGMEYETPEDFAAALEQVFNVDAFLRYMAVVNSLGNWDSYPYTGNNYYLFNNAGTGKFEWIPWDLSWGDNPQHPLFDLSGPGLVARAPLYEKVFQVTRYRTRYAGYLDLLTRYWFTEDNISALARRYHNLIAPLITQGAGDKVFFGKTAMFPIEAFNDSWVHFGEFAQQRHQYIRAELALGAWKLPTSQPGTPTP